ERGALPRCAWPRAPEFVSGINNLPQPARVTVTHLSGPREAAGPPVRAPILLRRQRRAQRASLAPELLIEVTSTDWQAERESVGKQQSHPLFDSTPADRGLQCSYACCGNARRAGRAFDCGFVTTATLAASHQWAVGLRAVVSVVEEESPPGSAPA